MAADKDFNLLNSTLKWMLKDRKFHICIHDLSGIIHQNSSLQIPQKNTIHSCKFCEYAKLTTRGFKFCLKCKELSLKKALTKKNLFIGQCYLGITEIVKPIYFNDKPVCVVYLGNITLKEQTSNIYSNIDRISNLTGVKRQYLIESLDTTEKIDISELSEYEEIVEIIGSSILQHINQGMKLSRKSASALPSYRSTNNWVIELIQNYIQSYYDRDLQLSQLAKLYFLNPQYLCRLFKKETGTNFSDYLNSVRIDKAKQLLSMTEANIVDISIDVGYKNVTYFNRLFKKNTGMTPKEYRIQNTSA
ncbi:helix-turn-helix domain-containing protein [Clostridium sp. YIM B02505]|uniref:Helix-turn-helix domain-containing protein n=1 Tax=Clostridium yunnanense TaxID=2800325 RepID=A0ABS1EKF9_9CLOT|nr:helix-turn-helix domain-containing protein [Clostridium yunnanense]MBK1809844.1 helix-turn-helix domain-containing protein [Clostridium yunnanense]